MHNGVVHVSQFEAVKHAIDVLDPIRVGTSVLDINIHPQTRVQYEYIRETWMEAAITSGWIHNEDEFYANVKGLGKLKNNVTLFCITR